MARTLLPRPGLEPYGNGPLVVVELPTRPGRGLGLTDRPRGALLSPLAAKTGQASLEA